MKCVRCGEKSEVLETTQRGETTRRRRRCLNPHCQHRFTTVEADQQGLVKFTEQQQYAALKKSFPGRDVEAIQAALATDRRREQIKREQKRRAEVYEDEDQPSYLDQQSLRRTLHGY